MPSLEEMPPYGFPVWDPRVKIDQLFYYLKKKKNYLNLNFKV